MAEKQQDQKDTTRAEVTATCSTRAEHDAELDALLNSKNGVANSLSVPLFAKNMEC
jgi:hypothetical protein